MFQCHHPPSFVVDAPGRLNDDLEPYEKIDLKSL